MSVHVGNPSAGVGGALPEGLLALVPPGESWVVLEYADGSQRAADFCARHGFVGARKHLAGPRP